MSEAEQREVLRLFRRDLQLILADRDPWPLNHHTEFARRQAFRRRVMIRLKEYGYSLPEIGAMLGVTGSAVYYSLNSQRQGTVR